ncbi:MAG TPA: glycosyltransferase [Candidatus Cloacimonadota bacterium]|nr:glycosyltransferase [Candidatus Cloacimonadota bacterium]
MTVDISLITAKDGSKVPVINNFPVHSTYQPIEEGNRLANTIINANHGTDLPLIVFGLGFGFHIRPLLNHFKRIIVIESLSELIRVAIESKAIEDILPHISIIEKLEDIPYLPEYHSLALRSEYRWQEGFFQEAQKRLSLKKSSYQIKPDELRVLVNFPIYGGSFTTAEYVSQAFKELGCVVETMDNSLADKMLDYILKLETNQNAFAKRLTDMMSDLLWDKYLKFKPHIVFCLAQAPIEPQVINAIRKAGSVVAFWFVEDFRRFPYWQDVIDYVDCFFHIQRGEFEYILDKAQINKAMYLPMASSANFMELAKNDNTDSEFYKADISFMGAAFTNRVNFFSQLHGFNLKLWGTGWYDFDIFKDKCPLQEARISIAQSVKIYQNSKININLHSAMADNVFNQYGDFVNPRTFEILAAHGFQLVDDSPVIREFFTPDEDLVVFNSIEEAVDKIKFYLNNDALRKKIAENGYRKVMQYYTYKDRMNTALNYITKEFPNVCAQVEEEQGKVEKIIKSLNDKTFTNIIKQIPPALRNSSQLVLDTFIQDEKNTTYKTIFKLLGTFLEGE